MEWFELACYLWKPEMLSVLKIHDIVIRVMPKLKVVNRENK